MELGSILSTDQVNHYNEQGFVLAKGLFTPDEAKYFRDETHVLAERLMAHRSIDATWRNACEMDEKRGSTVKTKLLHGHDVQFQLAAFARLITDERLVGAASQCIGSPNVQLHHTKMFIKPPEKGSPFPMHQDAPYFPHDKHSMMAAIIHFDEASEEKGCVRIDSLRVAG